MKKRTIKQELLYLSSMEFLAMLFFWIIYSLWIVLEKDFASPIIYYPLMILSIILVEGSFYWLSCLRELQKKSWLSQQKIASIYQLLKRVNGVLLVIYLPIFFFSNDGSRVNRIIGLFIWLFSIIEQINYFHYRLSYYTKSGLGLQIIKPLKLLLSGRADRSQIAKKILLNQKKSL